MNGRYRSDVDSKTLDGEPLTVEIGSRTKSSGCKIEMTKELLDKEVIEQRIHSTHRIKNSVYVDF